MIGGGSSARARDASQSRSRSSCRVVAVVAVARTPTHAADELCNSMASASAEPFGAAKIVSPGDRLGLAAEVAAGDGCHVWGEHVHASVVGRATLEAVGGVPTACVVRDRLDAPAVPAVGDVVVGRVTRVNPRMAHVDILVVRGGALREASTGLIRREDVRDYEADRVEIYRSFRPGDVVRARVLSLGDARAYYLTTAAIELGVIFAQSAAGHTMAAVSWEELECPVTKERAFRKVAKPAEGAAAAAAPDDAT